MNCRHIPKINSIRPDGSDLQCTLLTKGFENINFNSKMIFNYRIPLSNFFPLTFNALTRNLP